VSELNLDKLKPILMGEFKVNYPIHCPECSALDRQDDENCPDCLGTNEVSLNINVPWTTIKDILKEAEKHRDQRNNGWISVEDRPIDGQRIVSLGIPDGDTEYRSTEFTYRDKVGFISNIKLWKAIPQPPKEEV
jgi:hypothetical protein